MIWKEGGGVARIFRLILSQIIISQNIPSIINMVRVEQDLAPKVFDRCSLKLIFTSLSIGGGCYVLPEMVLNTYMIRST